MFSFGFLVLFIGFLKLQCNALHIGKDIVSLYQYDLEVIMNNNWCIICNIEGNPLLMYIWRVSDLTYSPFNDYWSEQSYHTNHIWDSQVGWVKQQGAPKVLSSSWIYSQTNYNPSHVGYVGVIGSKLLQ